MSNSANEKMQKVMQQMTYEEKLIVLAALERHLSERETVLSPAR